MRTQAHLALEQIQNGLLPYAAAVATTGSRTGFRRVRWGKGLSHGISFIFGDCSVLITSRQAGKLLARAVPPGL
jgi:hypothetical protein